RRGRCWTPTTPASTTSRNGSSSTSPCGSCGASAGWTPTTTARPAPSCSSSDLPAWARHHWASRSLAPSVVSSSGSPSVGAETKSPELQRAEKDQVGGDLRGDPSSARIEVLVPAQNHTFRDHSLEADLDLSDVLFMATDNVLETIPAPLPDRTEVISIAGYT